MGATGIEPMTSTVSITARLYIVLVRLRSSCAAVLHFASLPRFRRLLFPNVSQVFVLCVVLQTLLSHT